MGVAVASLDKVKLAAMAGILPENVNFGIHLDVVKRFLSDLKIEMPTINGSFDPELSCVQIVVSE